MNLNDMYNNLVGDLNLGIGNIGLINMQAQQLGVLGQQVQNNCYFPPAPGLFQLVKSNLKELLVREKSEVLWLNERIDEVCIKL